MAPGLRSSGQTGRPSGCGGRGGGCSLLRTDTGAVRRCVRTRWRAGAGGMPVNCLLSVGMLSLIVRCALAAEERSSYDASGSSFLVSDPTATAAPRHPLADLSAVGAVPFSDMHLESASESKGEGLSGWPAFSSVFTVMAGTVKHPVSLVQSRTSPTITRDEDHTTQWPSFSSSLSSTSSGLAKSMPNDHVTPPQTVSGPQHLFLMDRGNNMSMFSSPAASSPSVQSPFSFSPSIQLKTHSSQGQVIASRFFPQMKSSAFAPTPGWTKYTESGQLAAVTQRPENTKHFPLQEKLISYIRPSTEQSNTVDAITRASEKYHSNTETKAAGSSHKQHLSLGVSYRAAQSQNPVQNFLLANHHETSTLFPSDQESLHLQRQKGSSQNPTSALLSPLPKAYSLSSHVTQQMSNRTKNETEVLAYTSIHKTQGKAIMSPFGSHAVNPRATTVTFSTSQSFFTVTPATASGKGPVSEAVITKPARIHSSTGSLEHASNPDDLLMAAGHDGPKASTIIMNYDQGEIPGAEFTSISSQAYLNKSLFLSQPRPTKFTSPGSIPSLVSGVRTSSLLSAPETLHLTQVTTDKEFTTQTSFPMGIYQERKGYTTVKKKLLLQSWGMSLFSSELPVKKKFVTPLNKSELTVASATASFEKDDHRMPFTGSYMTQRGRAAESVHMNTAKTSVPALLKKESTLYLDNTFHKEVVTSTLPSFIATKDDDIYNKGSGEKSQIPISSQSFATSDPPKSKDDVTLRSRNRQSSSWSEIAITLRTNSTTGSQGPITSLRSDKSKFYLGRKTTIFYSASASSAAATSSSDGQRSSAIFSFGTQPLAHYTKRKTSMIVPFQSSAFISETTSVGFPRSRSDLQTTVTSYEHPNWGNGQQSNVDISTTYTPFAANELYSFNPKTERHLGVSRQQSVDLSSADSTSVVSFTLNPLTSSDLGSDGFLPVLDTAADHANTSETSSTSLPVVLGVGLNNVLSFTHNDEAKDVKLKGQMSTLSSSSLQSSASSSQASSLSPSSSVLTPTFFKSVTSFPFSLHIKPDSKSPEVSSGLSSSTNKATKHPFNTLLSVSVKKVLSHLPFSTPTLSLHPHGRQEMTESFVVLTASGAGELTTATTISFPKEKETSLSPSQSVVFAGASERTSQVLSLTPLRDTTTASEFTTTKSSPDTTTASLEVTEPFTATFTTARPTTTTRRPITTTANKSQTNRRTLTPPVPRTSPPRWATTVFISPFTTTTETPPQQCNITERMWVKTVVSIYVRRNRLDSIQRQNLRRGLSQGLRKALNDSSAQAQVETVFGSPNMTVAFHVTGGDIVYPPSVVLEGLNSYGRDKLIADLRQYLPMVTALPMPVALWRASPATSLQLKTVLQFVGAGDDPRSCRFFQMMEQRLEKVFFEAQAKVFSTNSRLSVQMLSVSQAAGSPAVSLVYTVRNGTVFLNGTTASNLLGQLSAELVGYFLFYPPLIVAEPLEYHNLNTSVATRDFWVITVIQDVDNTSLEGQYQSFASLMEQRLAELFVLAGQHGTRFRRATTVGSFTVQMVGIRRISGLKNPAEMTYYVQHNGVPLSGTSAAKVLNTVDSQTMALTLGYFVQLQAEAVVKNPSNNLWIIAAVLAPIAVVTLIIIIITAVLCRKNKNDFKTDAIGNLNPRAKMAYRRDVGFYHQPVQGFDYAKQHLGRLGGDEEALPVSQDTLVMSLQIKDTPLSLEKALQQDGTANKKSLTSDKYKSKLPSEDGSVISNESEKLNSSRGLTAAKVTAQQKLTKEESRNRDDAYDSSSGSLQLISIKPMVTQPNYSHPALSDRSKETAIINGEINMALKQKSDIEHYRNKLRLKAKKKGYYDFPSMDGSINDRALSQKQFHGHGRSTGELGRPQEPEDERGSTYVKSNKRHSQVGQPAYRSRQSLSSPSPGGTEMDLLVMRERPRRGIRNSGYDTEPELIEETNVDRLVGQREYMYGRGLKGHSETSTLSSQPSIDEVRQQMHLLLEEAFSLASGGQSTSGRHSHHHHPQPPPPSRYSPAPPPLPYADVVTSAPGTMSCGRGGLQWVPSYGSDMYQCSLPKPTFRFTQLPEMALGSPPPLPPRTGPPPGTSLKRSTSDLGPKTRSSENSVNDMQSQHENNPYGLTTRAALPSITAEQPVSNYSGNPITAVYAIPASRSGYSEYFVSTPPTSYHSPSWMSYPPEPEDVLPQWTDSVPLPGYVEAFPHPRYPQASPMRLPLQYHQALEQPPSSAPSTVSQHSLPPLVKDMDSLNLSSLSTTALVQAIRQEVAKLAKKQNDMFDY